MKLITILVIFTIITLISCIKEEKTNCPTSFELPAQVIPYKNLYHIGDTIILVSKFSKYVYEVNTKKTYNMENITWPAGFRTFRIDSSNNFDDALQSKINDYFSINDCSDLNFSLFSFSNGGDALSMTYKFKTDSFNLSLEISPKREGLFIITFGGGLDNSEQKFEGKCNNVSFNAYGTLNKGKDNNIDLLGESPMEHCNTWILQKPDERFYKKRYFVLKVIN